MTYLAQMGLSPDEVLAVEEQMRNPYQTRVLLGLLDYQHRWVTPEMPLARVSGSVQMKAASDGVSRSLGLELFDPTDILGLGSGADLVTPNRMISVRKGIYVDRYSRWYDIPTFFGPITKPDRADAMLTIEAQDKAHFALEHRVAYTAKEGTNLASAMRDVLSKVCGETRFRVASTTRKLSKTHNLTHEYTPIQFIDKVCRSLGWVWFWDAEGYFVAKPRPVSPVAHFRTGPGGLMTTSARPGYWTNEIKNRVVVTGKVVAGVALKAVAELPPSHPLSAQSLATGGAPWQKSEVIDDPDLGTTAECKAAAEERLAELAIQQTTVAMESLGFWHLQEFDPFTVEVETGTALTSFEDSTIPLDGSPQSFGFQRPTPRARSFKSTTNSSKVQKAKRKPKARAK